MVRFNLHENVVRGEIKSFKLNYSAVLEKTNFSSKESCTMLPIDFWSVEIFFLCHTRFLFLYLTVFHFMEHEVGYLILYPKNTIYLLA